MSRHSVLVYCRWGLVRPVANPEEHGWYFNSEAIATVRHVEYLRVHEGVNLCRHPAHFAAGGRIWKQVSVEMVTEIPPFLH